MPNEEYDDMEEYTGHENGHGDLQEEEELLEDIQRNGHRGYYAPAQSRLAIARDNGGTPEPFNVPKELITGSTRPEDWLTRSRFSEDEIANLVRTCLEMNWATAGHCDEEGQLWVFGTARASLDGQARDEVIQVSQGFAQRRMEDHRNALERLTRLSQDNPMPNNGR